MRELGDVLAKAKFTSESDRPTVRRLVNDFEWLVMQSIADAEMGTGAAAPRPRRLFRQRRPSAPAQPVAAADEVAVPPSAPTSAPVQPSESSAVHSNAADNSDDASTDEEDGAEARHSAAWRAVTAPSGAAAVASSAQAVAQAEARAAAAAAQAEALQAEFADLQSSAAARRLSLRDDVDPRGVQGPNSPGTQAEAGAPAAAAEAEARYRV